jgi:hypothetical protein
MGLNSNVTNRKIEQSTDGLFTEVGGVKIRRQIYVDENNSEIPKNNSYVLIQDMWGSLVRFWRNHIVIRSAGGLSINVGGNKNESIKGDEQKAVAGNSIKYTKQNDKTIKGVQTNKEKKASEELEKINQKVQKARIDAAVNSKRKTSCPICNQKHLADRGTDLVTSAIRTIERYLGLVIPWKCFPFDLLHLLATLLISPFLSLTRNISIRGQSCGSPACKNGVVEVPDLNKADQAGARAIKAEQNNISKFSKELKSGGSEAVVYKTDVITKIGLTKNQAEAYKEVGHHTFPLKFVPAEKKRDVLAYDSKGSTKRILFLPPQRTQGSWMFDVANNFTINAGSPGIDFQSSGQLTADVGSLSLKAGLGEAYLGSNNVTTLKGKNVILDANDQSGDAGVLISSPHTMVQGSFNVRGDAAFKGHVTMDGALSAPHLIVPSMRTESTANATSKFKTEGANFAGSSQALAAANLAKDLLLRYLYPGYMTTSAGWTSLAVEVYDLLLTSSIIHPEPTGIFIGVCPVGPCAGLIFNFRHNHMRSGEDHSHTVTSPKASYWNTKAGWGSERTAGSPVPTPAAALGDSMSPGPKSKAGGGCGGGGLWIKQRNDRYGLPTDPYKGGNFVPGKIKRTPDGNITPPPQFSYYYNCIPYTTAINIPQVPIIDLPNPFPPISPPDSPDVECV